MCKFDFVSDITLDVDTLTKEQMLQLNQCGVQFGMGKDDYVRYVDQAGPLVEPLKPLETFNLVAIL